MALLLVRQFSSGGLLDDIHIKARVVWGDEANSNSRDTTLIRKKKRENKNNDNNAPISKHVVVLIPNSASLRGETTVMATASIATKKPPYCNRMPLREKDVIFFFLFF